MKFVIEHDLMPSPRPRINTKTHHDYYHRDYKSNKEILKFRIKSEMNWCGVKTTREPMCFNNISIFTSRKSGDIDNYLKTFLDACGGAVYKNDNQVERIKNLNLHRNHLNPFIEFEIRIL